MLSLFLGGGSAPYYRDTIAIGAFTAVEKGIFVSCFTGNSGPIRASLANVAPWIMTVGASTIDRDFCARCVHSFRANRSPFLLCSLWVFFFFFFLLWTAGTSGGGFGVFRFVVGKWACICVCGSGLVLVVGFFLFSFFGCGMPPVVVVVDGRGD